MNFELNFDSTVYMVNFQYVHIHYCHTLPLADIQSKLRTLERASKSLKSEKSSLLEEVSTLRSQIADKDKALRGVKGQMQEAQDEVTKLTDRLAEVKSQKAKFSRLAREKGEEIGKCWEEGCGVV